MKVITKNNMSAGFAEDELTDSTKKYFNEITKYPNSDPYQELEQFRLIRAGDEIAREKMITSHAKFVVFVAKHYRLPELEINDLIQEGNIGLIYAINHFDATRGFKFMSYAIKCIQGHIINYIGKNKRLLSFKNGQDKNILSKIGMLQDEFIKRYGQNPTSRDLSDICGELYDVFVDPKKIASFLLYDQRHVSIGNGDVVDYTSKDMLMQDINHNDLSTDIARVLSTLPQTEESVIMLYYGIGVKKSMTLEEIAIMADVDKSRILAIKEKAIRRIGHKARLCVLKKYLG